MPKKNVKTPAIDIGISGRDRARIVQGLSELLADSYTLYLMTHNFHWNVTGPLFNSLHQMFMDVLAMAAGTRHLQRQRAGHAGEGAAYRRHVGVL